MNFHLIWALVVAGLVATNCATNARLESAQTVINTYKKDIKDQKEAAQKMLDEERAKKEAAEKALADLKAEQEKKDETNKKTVEVMAGKLVAAGRLRDPNADRCGGGGGNRASEAPAPTPSGDGDKAETGGLLSVQLTQLLSRVLRESDDINVAYASCRADSMKVRGLPVEPPEP